MKFSVKDTPEVIFCDNHLLVLHKPHGMLTQPSPDEKTSLEEWGKLYLKNRFDKKGNVFLEALHRLDKVTGGIVVFARTSKALTRMQEFLRDGKWEKTYLAQVEGHLQKKEDVLVDLLTHDDFRAKIDPKGKKSILSYKVLKEEQTTSLLEIALETGRYHQIRIQLSSRGHPVVGDQKYGSKIPFGKEAIALVHSQLKTLHPISKELLIFRANPI